MPVGVDWYSPAPAAAAFFAARIARAADRRGSGTSSGLPSRVSRAGVFRHIERERVQSVPRHQRGEILPPLLEHRPRATRLLGPYARCREAGMLMWQRLVGAIAPFEIHAEEFARSVVPALATANKSAYR